MNTTFFPAKPLRLRLHNLQEIDKIRGKVLRACLHGGKYTYVFIHESVTRCVTRCLVSQGTVDLIRYTK